MPIVCHLLLPTQKYVSKYVTETRTSTFYFQVCWEQSTNHSVDINLLIANYYSVSNRTCDERVIFWKVVEEYHPQAKPKNRHEFIFCHYSPDHLKTPYTCYIFIPKIGPPTIRTWALQKCSRPRPNWCFEWWYLIIVCETFIQCKIKWLLND